MKRGWEWRGGSTPHQAPLCFPLIIPQISGANCSFGEMTKTNMVGLGKETKTDMPVVEATGKARDTTASIPNLSLCFSF